jgi:predicted nucleotidyltransferase component of viral defense system
MIKFLQIPDTEKRRIYQDVSNKMGLPPQAVEKDVWVTLMLRMIFTSDHAEHFIFKGGTSLSKAFNLINRFSEDIDLGIDRKYLGFEGDLTPGQVRKLRRACHSYVSGDLKNVLENKLIEYGVDPGSYELKVENTQVSDQDPETIQVNFKSLFHEVSYLANNIKIEVSARSLIEPNQKVFIQSWIDQQYPGASFVDKPFEVIATDPRKTFLEKLILLHEEFQKPSDKIRYYRMSRHFYDLDQLLDLEFGNSTLEDKKLFESIIAHRRVLTPVKTTNYDSLELKSLNIIPPAEQLETYKADYKEMQMSMIHGKSNNFESIIEKIQRNLSK